MISNGVELAVDADGRIVSNAISGVGTALAINAPFTGPIEDNNIHNANFGVAYAAAADLKHNRIFNNTVGIHATVDSDVLGLGFTGDGGSNEIFSNETGVSLLGRMQNQHVFGNETGVIGAGLLGGGDLDTANLIEANDVGVDFEGKIQFNRIARNAIGVLTHNDQEVVHNLLYRNTDAAILANGVSDVTVANNTFYAPEGDNLRITGGSSRMEVLGNILWVEDGYNIYIANDSQAGFYSDFNIPFTLPDGGKLVYWTKDFHDILDWQADVARFDLHSVGATVVNPRWSEPRFLARSRDDYRLFDHSAGKRFSSPTLDAGAFYLDHGLPDHYVNLLTNPGFESGLDSWTVNPTASTKDSSPEPYRGGLYFSAGATDGGSTQQTIDLLAAGWDPVDLDSEDLVGSSSGGRVRAADESPPDQGRLAVVFLDTSGAEITQTSADAKNAVDRWELLGGRHSLPAGTRYISYQFFSAKVSGSTADSYLDDGFLYIVSEAVAPDQGAHGNTDTDDDLRSTTQIALRFPDLYTDWERHKQQSIRWDSFQNDGESAVRIDLYQDGPDGPEFLLNLTSGTADTGAFDWIPEDSGIGFGVHRSA